MLSDEPVTRNSQMNGETLPMDDETLFPTEPTSVCGLTSGTIPPGECTEDTSETATDGTYELFSTERYQISMSSVLAFLALLFRRLAEEGDLKTREELWSSTYFAYLRENDLRIFSLKTLRDFSGSTEEESLPTSSGCLHRWGIASNGVCLTVRAMEYPRLAPDYSLLEILEKSPDPKYSLSEEKIESIRTRKARYLEKKRSKSSPSAS